MKTTLAFAIFLSMSGAVFAQTTYKIAEQGGPNCTASGINDYAGVVGQCDATATAWVNGVTNTLGRLPKGTYSIAQSSNSQAVAVGDGDAGDGRPRAVLFRNGSVTDIDPSAANAHAFRISEAGVIAGNYLHGFGTCNSWAVSIWNEDLSKPGTFHRTELQPYPGGDGKVRCESGTAANQSMQVVGWVQNSLFGQMGAFWNNDAKHTLSLLQPLPGDWTSIAWGVNDQGQTVGESHPPFVSRPVMWNNDPAHTPVALPMLPGDNYGTALAVNNLGQAIGRSAYAVPGSTIVGPNRFVVWSNGSVFDLQTLLDATSGAGWTITDVTAINNLGQIVGTGTHNGQVRAFQMTPNF